MSDGHYDAPAYCVMCDRPIATGPLCDGCLDSYLDDDYELINVIVPSILVRDKSIISNFLRIDPPDDAHLEAAYEERMEADDY